MTDVKAVVAKEKGIVFGTEKTLKNIKAGKTKKVLIASDCLSDTKETLMRYAKIARAEVEQLKIPSEEIGMICKKPFPISVLSY